MPDFQRFPFTALLSKFARRILSFQVQAVVMSKMLLRKAILTRRLSLSGKDYSSYSRIIQEAFISLPEFQSSRSIALYCAVNNEVSTETIIEHALLNGKIVYLPAVVGTDLEFRRLSSLNEVSRGSFGILEPSDQAEVADIEQFDMVVVPGVGFDLAGQRIGYGKGYYDRTFHRLEGSGRLTGLCFEFQIVDSLAGEKHDVVMDRIITERRIIIPALLK